MKRLDRLIQRWRISKAVPFIKKGAKVFDIGSGNGKLFEVLGDRISFGIGLEPLLPETIEGPRYRVIPAIFPPQMPFAQKFDIVTIWLFWNTFPKRSCRCATRPCRELLNTGGHVIITVPSRYVDGILNLMRFLKLVDAETPGEHHGFDVSMVAKLFSAAHFRLATKKNFNWTSRICLYFGRFRSKGFCKPYMVIFQGPKYLRQTHRQMLGGPSQLVWLPG